MMQQQITPTTFEEHVRKRPGMYIGSTDEKGILYLLEMALVDVIEMHQTDRFTFTVALYPEFWTLEVEGEVNSPFLINRLTGEPAGYMFLKALMALSARFECSAGENLLVFDRGMVIGGEQHYRYESKAQLSLAFKLDDTVFANTNLDFHRLSEKLKRFAMLNRGMQLIIKDHREACLSQNYFHYPDGIKRLFESTLHEKHSGSLFELFIDNATNAYAYQLGIGFNRALWNTAQLSFANEVHTYQGGSLNNGVVQGVISALKIYTAGLRHRSFKFTPKKVAQGITLVLAVRGEELDWKGCTKAELDVPVIKKESCKLTCVALLKYLHEHADQAAKFIAMFEVTTYIQTERSLAHCSMACLVAQKRVAVLANAEP